MLKKILFKVHSSLFSKTIAFTLAETLIVMGIIGVVAALTLPNLNSSTGDKEKVAKVKKVYSNLNDAMGRAIVVYGPYNTWAAQKNMSANQIETSGSTILERMSDFLKITKKCDPNSALTAKACVNMFELKSLNESILHNGPDLPSLTMVSGEGAILSDGTGIWCSGISNKSGAVAYITIDIDGVNKGSNTFGKDIFRFIIDGDTGEVFPEGYDDLTNSKIISNVVQSGTYAAAWIVQNDNADYLKVDGRGKCLNNKDITLSTSNISCR